MSTRTTTKKRRRVMLKIKDDVNLKELERFGFEEISIGRGTKYQLKKYIGKCEIYNIKIDTKKIIRFNQLSVNNELPDILYDLIQAGLVEKVREE